MLLFKQVSSVCLAFVFRDSLLGVIRIAILYLSKSPMPVWPKGLQSECGRTHQGGKQFSFTWVTAIMQNDKRSS